MRFLIPAFFIALITLASPTVKSSAFALQEQQTPKPTKVCDGLYAFKTGGSATQKWHCFEKLSKNNLWFWTDHAGFKLANATRERLTSGDDTEVNEVTEFFKMFNSYDDNPGKEFWISYVSSKKITAPHPAPFPNFLIDTGVSSAKMCAHITMSVANSDMSSFGATALEAPTLFISAAKQTKTSNKHKLKASMANALKFEAKTN